MALLSHGERVVRVPPKLMAGARKSARAYGKCDSIDALAIARAALAHPDLPAAEDDLRARDLQLLVSHRESLVRQRSETQDRLRWLLHALEPRTPCPGGRSRSQARPRLSGAKAGRRQESLEALRALKRHLARVVFRLLRRDPGERPRSIKVRGGKVRAPALA